MIPTQIRKSGVFFLLAILLWWAPQIVAAHVEGTHGLAPTLPPNVPGVNRAFPQDEEKFTFAIIGDKTGGGQKNWPIFDRAIGEVNHVHPDFAIMVGDLIQGYITDPTTMDEQWQEFTEHVEHTQVPFFYLPGNHDISNKVMYDYWDANVGRTYYSFGYKGCYFMLLNTEEGWRADEVQFGSEQIEWIRETIQAHQDAKHFFLFMHRPVWYTSGESLAQWESIESWLADIPYTVFAGHFHNLSYETRRDRRYFVLSATGAGLSEQDVLQLGAFHHYSLVTVDHQDVHIAIIQPGNVHPYDIARRDFTENVRQMLTQLLEWETPLSIMEGKHEQGLSARLNNRLDNPLTVAVSLSTADGSSWSFAPREAVYTVQPGQTTQITFKAAYDFESLLPLPSFAYDLTYEGKRLWQISQIIAPELTPIMEWLAVGPFALAAEETPAEDAATTAMPSAFARVLEPEKNWDAGQTYSDGSQMLAWKEASSEDSGWVNFGSIFGGDSVVGYGLCYIHAPEARRVLAGFRGDDWSKILVDGEQVYSTALSTNLNYFILSLKEGWNTVLVKCADEKGGWGYTLQIADPQRELRFTRHQPDQQ